MTFLEFVSHVLDSHWPVVLLLVSIVGATATFFFKVRQWIIERKDLRSKDEIAADKQIQDGFSAQICDLVARVKMLWDRLTAVESEREVERTRWVGQRTDLEQQLVTLRTRVQSLEGQLATAYADRDVLMEQMKMLKLESATSIEALLAQIKALQAEIVALKAQIAILQKRLIDNAKEEP